MEELDKIYNISDMSMWAHLDYGGDETTFIFIFIKLFFKVGDDLKMMYYCLLIK